MHPEPPAGVDFHSHLNMSDAQIIEAHLSDGRTREYAHAQVVAVRSFVLPSGPNLDYEQMIQAEMAETGLTREELDELWAKRKAESVAELARLVALDETASS